MTSATYDLNELKRRMQGAVQVFALAYGKNTSRGNQTVIPNDDPSIVQRRLREKDRK